MSSFHSQKAIFKRKTKDFEEARAKKTTAYKLLSTCCNRYGYTIPMYLSRINSIPPLSDKLFCARCWFYCKPLLKIFLCDPWTTKAFISSCIIHLVAFRHGAPSSKCFRRSASRYRSNMRWIPRRRQDVFPEFPTVYSFFFFWGGCWSLHGRGAFKMKEHHENMKLMQTPCILPWFWDLAIGYTWFQNRSLQLGRCIHHGTHVQWKVLH